MKKNLLFSLAALLSTFAFAQNCVEVLPNVSTYKVYDADTTHSTLGDIVWVCDGVTIEISGDGNTVFVEKDCDVSGDDNTVYQRTGGSLTITGTNNGSNGTLKYDSHVTYTDNGTGTIATMCDTMTYDYTHAPVAPKKFCMYWATVDNVKEDDGFRTYPNPVQDVLYVQMPRGEKARTANIYSTTGQLVQIATVDVNTVDVSGLKSGLYFMIIRTLDKQYSVRLTVE